MPQLDPSPWFLILMSSWIILILFAPAKMSKFINLNSPTMKANKTITKPWFWPWP
uniref:ATP synthase F0 subunit 8 n=1 Tax=Phyllomedusa bahiana TaxID=860369 RepID=UPI0021FE3CE4|nr:ATP synthase F0 subunit 8 [Phyllomedusa bahiana]UXL87082.1 ATP synthase F0 subunit 8 [Phyllomedusa bahiana]